MSDTVSSQQLLQQLHWRYATKKFDPTKKIPTDVWKTLEQTLVLAPSSFGLQPWKFFVITDPDLREQLVGLSWGQRQVADASHLVVLAIKKELTAADVDRFIQRTAEVRHVPLDSLQGYSNTIKGFLEKPPVDPREWAARQVYIALGQFMTSAALLEIDTCPMEGFDVPKVNELLKLEEQGYYGVVMCPAGYRAEDDKYASLPKVRFAEEAVISHI